MIGISTFGPVAALLLALLLGGLIGLERQWRRHPAGLHTNALVALGSAIYMSAVASGDSSGRVLAQITTGVGFLCAGVIMREGATIRGLNTAATVWCSAAVGVLCGSSQFALALGAAASILLGNILLHWLEHDLLHWPSDNSKPN